uniref:Uncharacterized protein n=1 Tax=Cucumis melo TaxID=3656 RepID=A0A9I9EKU5_CUCME
MSQSLLLSSLKKCKTNSFTTMIVLLRCEVLMVLLKDANKPINLKAKTIVAAQDKDINSMTINRLTSLRQDVKHHRAACVWRSPNLVSIVVLRGHKRVIWYVTSQNKAKSLTFLLQNPSLSFFTHTPLSFFKIHPLTNDERRMTKTPTLTSFFSSPRPFFLATETHGEETHSIACEFLEIKAKGDFMAMGGSYEKKRMKMNDNVDLGTACGKYYRVSCLSIIDPGFATIHLSNEVIFMPIH